VEIYERSGKIYGKIVDIVDAEKRKSLCTACSGEEKKQTSNGTRYYQRTQKTVKYNDGKILDPTTGKLYKCFLAEGHDKLKSAVILACHYLVEHKSGIE
jgi:uncharacterized protein (DUF2147 family)